jgi:Domain of unknown function (DUF4136)
MGQSPSFAFAAFALGLAALVGGCASTPSTPQPMRDPQADFSAYRTIGWNAGAGDGKPGQAVSIVDGYIRSAITTELTRKGYTEAAAGTTPDLYVEFETASAEKLKNNPFRVGIGVGSWGRNTGGSVGVSSPSVKSVKEGSLVVHVVDTARKAEVWRSGISRELGKGNVQQAAVQSAVAELLRDFPARTAAP